MENTLHKAEIAKLDLHEKFKNQISCKPNFDISVVRGGSVIYTGLQVEILFNKCCLTPRRQTVSSSVTLICNEAPLNSSVDEFKGAIGKSPHHRSALT